MIKQYTTSIIALLVLVAGFSLHSCSDVLNQAPDGKITLEEVFQDDEKVAA
jgi:hypothetical protein